MGLTGQGLANLDVERGALRDCVCEQRVEGLDLGTGERCGILAEEDGAEVDLGYGQLGSRHVV